MSSPRRISQRNPRRSTRRSPRSMRGGTSNSANFNFNFDDGMSRRLSEKLGSRVGADGDSEVEYYEATFMGTFNTQNDIVKAILRADKKARKWDTNRPALTKPMVVAALNELLHEEEG